MAKNFFLIFFLSPMALAGIAPEMQECAEAQRRDLPEIVEIVGDIGSHDDVQIAQCYYHAILERRLIKNWPSFRQRMRFSFSPEVPQKQRVDIKQTLLLTYDLAMKEADYKIPDTVAIHFSVAPFDVAVSSENLIEISAELDVFYQHSRVTDKSKELGDFREKMFYVFSGFIEDKREYYRGIENLFNK